ncbi:Uncharacterized protein family UPF0114 - like 2 [Theobroma cacao]|uniref:Uncharacterized protein LOC18591316 n=1 Tax=Theobroma cacao TaxID=3641 RepID=A0AB32UUB7_THECC|nr:PREDICTED: uncharacterized protein LOC18591316 [Theobroma cacao]WRX30569.1 Uncharacterized protein family UPF0114 - like 2 [Theobroma cacao]
MATTRLLRSSNKPLGRIFAPSSSWPSSSVKNVRCVSKGGLDGEKKVCGSSERKPTVAVKAASVAAAENVVISEPRGDWGKELASSLAVAINAMRQVLVLVVKPRPWRLQVQMLIEKVIIDSRFFTLFAVAGSLLGSVLCFMEGCFLILESYLQYFHNLSQKSDQEHIIHLLIEAIDMFLVGTAMLIFGMGLYIMFVGSKTMKGGAPSLPRSNLFGLFPLKTLPAWVEMKSVSQAKSKIGHAVMMILQVGVLEKFKSIPTVTSLDLACFAGAVFVSSACIFLLSRLSAGGS